MIESVTFTVISLTADEETLWTDKYQPTCAADILGNSKQVKKLWTWLKEWKDRTDMEIKRLKKQLMKEARSGKITKEEAKKSKFCFHPIMKNKQTKHKIYQENLFYVIRAIFIS